MSSDCTKTLTGCDLSVIITQKDSEAGCSSLQACAGFSDKNFTILLLDQYFNITTLFIIYEIIIILLLFNSEYKAIYLKKTK